MAKIEVNKQEARLLAVYRAIKELNKKELITQGDVGDALEALEAIVELDEVEKELDAEQMRALLKGFVAGLAATRLGAPDEYKEFIPQVRWEDGEGDDVVSGGPSGGVLRGQGQDGSYVTQSGVHG